MVPREYYNNCTRPTLAMWVRLCLKLPTMYREYITASLVPKLKRSGSLGMRLHKLQQQVIHTASYHVQVHMVHLQAHMHTHAHTHTHTHTHTYTHTHTHK